MSQDVFYNSPTTALQAYAVAGTFTGRSSSVGGNSMTKVLQAITQYKKGNVIVTTYKNMTEEEVREQIALQGTKDTPAPTIIAIVPAFIYS